MFKSKRSPVVERANNLNEDLLMEILKNRVAKLPPLEQTLQEGLPDFGHWTKGEFEPEV